MRAAGSAIAGTLTVPANRGLGPLRLWLLGAQGFARALELRGGTYAAWDLPEGSYRVELRASRFVVARRVVLAPGEHAIVDFTLA
jgi:hypothetical protein